MKRIQLLSGLLLLALMPFASLAKAPDTLSVYFSFNESRLNDTAHDDLDSAIYEGRLSVGQSLLIIGYADAVGSDGFNIGLSRQRALTVKDYLLQSGFDERDIRLLLARGESQVTRPAQPGGYRPDRRVDIVSSNKPAPKTHTIRLADHIQRKPDSLKPLTTAPLDLSTVPAGQTLVLENIYFYPGRHIVRKESIASLQALLASLQAHPNIKIRIEGHVCCVSPYIRDAMDNDTQVEELSLNRAAAIREYLVAHGISNDRLSIAGFGHRHPIVNPERSEEDANRNRRVEIRVLK
ncbi:MAG: OmpA family protein [Bacteroidetes bacterium]|nr:OmpA family protein [Bacteroidota bacterium]